MVRLAAVTGAALGGWLGWMIGAQAGLTMAFIASVTGSAAGWYAGARIIKNYLG